MGQWWGPLRALGVCLQVYLQLAVVLFKARGEEVLILLLMLLQQEQQERVLLLLLLLLAMLQLAECIYIIFF